MVLHKISFVVKSENEHRQVSKWLTCLFFLTACFVATAMAKEAGPAPEVLAPGWSELEFEPPAAGSYQLPPLGLAGDGEVLDSRPGGQGEVIRLHSLMSDKLLVLSFIYSSCSDANGCPLATHVLDRIKNRLLEGSSGGDNVRFISLSFDPVQDTPDVMRAYGSGFVSEDFDWHFLTTSSESQLQPILDSYSQSVIRDPESEDGNAGRISHILRVFLIDRNKQIRNVYSPSFLHADSIINDIQTLQLESLTTDIMQGPGDDKQGYADSNYRTNAQSLQSRQGVRADLQANVDNPPAGLPLVPFPANNPVTPAKIELGRLLFFDRRLSHNKTISCAMCHIPEQGFSSNEMATAVGIEGRSVRRNSPTIYNVAYLERLFHDGRETTLEQQVWGPLLARNEMGNPSVGRVVEQISALAEYREMFAKAFAGRPISMETIGMALASYERALVSANSAFDRWHYGGDNNALSSQQKAGFNLFVGKAGCSACHLVGQQYALLTDNLLHNTGIGYQRSMAKQPGETLVLIAPGEHIVVKGNAVAASSEPALRDLGLYEITENPADRWKYRTPTLRNIALTAPYMHDGSISSLREVIRFYNNGGIENILRDPLVRPLNLSGEEANQLLSFLNALTGANVDVLVSDAFTVPIGNTEAHLN
jgi:cytochrome c peroxidase